MITFGWSPFIEIITLFFKFTQTFPVWWLKKCTRSLSNPLWAKDDFKMSELN